MMKKIFAQLEEIENLKQFSHKNALEIARRKNWKTGAFLAQLALTVRLHAIMQSFLMVFSSPSSALKVLVKAISPIR